MLNTHLRTVIIGFGIFLLQYFLSEHITIQQIRPDFLVIFIIYVALSQGSFAGVIYGFCFGLVEDLVGVGSLFGLASLTKSITGFLVGFLHGKYPKLNPFVFHLLWILIISTHFFIYVYIRFQTVHESSIFIFFKTWFLALCYTLAFVGLFQLIHPIHKVYPTD